MPAHAGMTVGGEEVSSAGLDSRVRENDNSSVGRIIIRI